MRHCVGLSGPRGELSCHRRLRRARHDDSGTIRRSSLLLSGLLVRGALGLVGGRRGRARCWSLGRMLLRDARRGGMLELD